MYVGIAYPPREMIFLMTSTNGVTDMIVIDKAVTVIRVTVGG